MIVLKNEFLTVAINTLGAEIKSIKYDELELLHDSNPKYWNRSAPYLFPNIGTIKDKYTIFDGVKYHLTKHGFIRDVEFKVLSQTESEATFINEANDMTLGLYPFIYQIMIHYCLKSNTIDINVSIINKDSKVMPFNFGLHPAFKVPFFENEAFEDYKILFDDCISFDTPTVVLETGLIDWDKTIKSYKNIKEIKLDHEDYKYDAIVINPKPSGSIKLVSPNSSSIDVKADDFKTLGIWTPYPVKAPFICIEPWIGYADAPLSNHEFNTKKDLINLLPNNIWETHFSYTFNIRK